MIGGERSRDLLLLLPVNFHQFVVKSSGGGDQGGFRVLNQPFHLK